MAAGFFGEPGRCTFSSVQERPSRDCNSWLDGANAPDNPFGGLFRGKMPPEFIYGNQYLRSMTHGENLSRASIHEKAFGSRRRS